MSSFIAAFKVFPKDLFRVNRGLSVHLRPWCPRRYVFDIYVKDGLVLPKALCPSSYQAPNGASMRPNSPKHHRLLSRLDQNPDVIVYSVPEGTRLPDDMLLVHEFLDHYSLQPAVIMTANDLNDKLTYFFWKHAKIYTRDKWLRAYGGPTEFPPYTRR